MPASPPASQPTAGRKIHVVPWLELSPLPGHFEPAVAGLKFWRKSTDTVIVSVGPKEAYQLKELRARVPELNYIPGLKTSPLLKPAGFDSVEAWRQIADVARELRQYTSCRVLLFEHESAIKPYIDGEYQMDWNKLEAGMKQLPADTVVLWYPSAGMSGDILERYLRLARSVEKVLNVIFVDHAMLHAPRYVKQPGTLRVVRDLREVASKPPVPLIYCCGEKYWPYDRVPEAVRLADTDWVIVYPGARWVEAAKSLSDIFIAQQPSLVLPPPEVPSPSSMHGVEKKP